MSKELIINASLPEIRIALLENGRMQEFVIERANEKGIVGNIFKGRVTRVLPGMQAAFVDIGLDKAAFLYVDDVLVHPPREDETQGVSEVLDSDSDTDNEFEASDSEDTDESIDSVVIVEESLEQSVAPDENDEAQADDQSVEEAELTDLNSEEDSSISTLKVEESDGEKKPSDLDTSAPGPDSSNQDTELMKLRRQKQVELQTMPEPMTRGLESIDAEVLLETDRSELAQREVTALLAEETSDEDDIGSDAPPREAESVDDEKIKSPKKTNRRFRQFRQKRSKDRRIRPKQDVVETRQQSADIGSLLKEGQEVLVQVAKDPIATKGARLTCHISLPGRHLVCMPTIDHIGVSRRIDSDSERKRLRELVEKNRKKKLGFIVRTASGTADSDEWIKKDIDYLTSVWDEIREKADRASCPSLIYEDLNSITRAVRDWVDEDFSKIIIDSRERYEEIKQFLEKAIPSLSDRLELYQGDLPIFDAFGLANEFHRALERKVWLKSGGYIVIDQAEALVAIDVNTGRYVGRKNLEDTILKTNLEAVEEIAYQLRLRNCGGIIIIDLIDMERDENKNRVYRALEEAIKRDRARPTIQKISDLGLIEMTRKRTRDTLVRALCQSCSHCEGRGFVKSKMTVAYEVLREIERAGVERSVRRILVQAHKEVIDLLAIEERATLDYLERKTQKKIYLQAVQGFHQEQFEVIGERNSNEKYVPQQNRERKFSRDRVENKAQEKPVATGKIIPKKPEKKIILDTQEMLIDSTPKVEPKSSVPVPKPELGADEDSQVNFGLVDHENESLPVSNHFVQPRVAAPVSEEDDEDSLAYLRAQAAQDAALINFGNADPNMMNSGNSAQPNNMGRGRNFRHQNNRRPNNNGNGGGSGFYPRQDRGRNKKHHNNPGRNRFQNGGRNFQKSAPNYDLQQPDFHESSVTPSGAPRVDDGDAY